MYRKRVLLLSGFLTTSALMLQCLNQGRNGGMSMTTYTLPSWGNGAPAVQLHLPPGYSLTSEKPADFDMHYLMPPTGLPKIGIYVGYHPNAFCRRVAAGDKSSRQDRVGGRPVTWTRWKEGDLLRSECIVSGLFEGGAAYGGLNLHIFIKTTSKDALLEAEKWFRDLALARPEK